MPNYLNPGAIEEWAHRATRSQHLMSIANPLQQMIVRWAREDDSNAKAIRQLPHDVEPWAQKAFQRGDLLHQFAAAPATREALRQLVAFLIEVVRVSKIEQPNRPQQLATEARRILRLVRDQRITIPELLDRRQRWLLHPEREGFRQDRSAVRNAALPHTEHGQWHECQTLAAVHRVGRALRNCLADGFHDEDFDNRDESGLRIFYLQGERILAVASFFHGTLDDFEATGHNREARQHHARDYRSDLLQLLQVLNYRVSPRDGRGNVLYCNCPNLVGRTGIFEQYDLDDAERFDRARHPHAIFWHLHTKEQEALIVCHRATDSFAIIDLRPGRLVSKAPAATNAGCPLISLTHDGEGLEDLTLKQFDQVCLGLALMKRVGRLPHLDLSRFFEFSRDGTYWVMLLKKRANTRRLAHGLGYLIASGGRAWWAREHNRQSLAVWYDANATNGNSRQQAVLSPEVWQDLRAKAKAYYPDPLKFWQHLACLKLALPDLSTKANGEPEIDCSIFEGRARRATAGWRLRFRRGKYQVWSRQVDDYRPLQHGQNPTEQWVCWYHYSVGLGVRRGSAQLRRSIARPAGMPVAGALVRYLSNRKREVLLQAPGYDATALSVLKSAMRDEQIINRYSPLVSDHDLRPLGQPIEAWLLDDKDQPFRINSTRVDGISIAERYRKIRLYRTEQNRLCLAMILQFSRDGQITDAALVGKPAPLQDYFYQAIVHLGLELTPTLDPVVQQFGYQVVDGALEPLLQPPETDDPRIGLSVEQRQVEIEYDPDGDQSLLEVPEEADDDDWLLRDTLPDKTLSIKIDNAGNVRINGRIRPDPADDGWVELQGVFCQAVNYLRTGLDEEIELVFGLVRQRNGRYVARTTTSKAPASWFFEGDGDKAAWVFVPEAGGSPWLRMTDRTIVYDWDNARRISATRIDVRRFIGWHDEQARPEHRPG